MAEGAEVTAGTLDPLGADHPARPDYYALTLRDMANAVAECLGVGG